MKLTSITLVSAAALALAAGASLAQPTGPQAGAHAEGHHWQRPDPAQMAERHAQHLRDTLQLRPDQEPALRALIAASQRPAGEREHMGKDRGDEHGLSTPQRLDRMEARMAERTEHFRAHAAAMKRFYAQLSPTQQKALDSMPMGGRGEGHEHGKGGGHEGHQGREHGDRGGPPSAGL